MVGQHVDDPRREVLGPSRFEGERGAVSSNQLSESPGLRGHQGRPTGEGLEGDDAERFVERRDHDAVGAMEGGAQGVVADEPGQVDDVAHPGHVDLGLEFGEVGAASSDHAAHPGHLCPHDRHGVGEHLEPLLVLHPPPGEHERGAGSRRGRGIDRLVVTLGRRPPGGIDASGNRRDEIRIDLEVGGHLASEEAGDGDHLPGPGREPPFHPVDLLGRSGRYVTAMATALRAVEGGDERSAMRGRQRRGRPGDRPIVGVHHVGPPRGIDGAERGVDEGVVGRRGAADRMLGHPGEVGFGPNDGDPSGGGDRRCAIGAPRHENHLVPLSGEGVGEAVDMGGGAAGVSRWEFP